ncbi:leucine-rich repeat protein [Perkinsela sp. CCAP 1560/4]|nr:leucine-rich repeat protein [Perkinsela sp. CCAP 1560/4]|eukprot:KNH04901.1 leucine-rich repeat protein [Perkinsela sp. CCAP 1560/4]
MHIESFVKPTIVLLAGIDSEPYVGRFGRDSMTDQQCMEVLLDGVFNTNAFKLEGYFCDVCDWKGVACDASNTVISVDWAISPLLMGGTVSLDYMPAQVESFVMQRQSMHGSLPVHDLSMKLRKLNLIDNFFGGEICWPSLSTLLEILLLDYNYFCGSIDLSQLPASLVSLGLSGNKFDGTIDITHLPSGLKRMYLSDNRLKQDFIEARNIPKDAECYIFTGNALGKVMYPDVVSENVLFF